MKLLMFSLDRTVLVNGSRQQEKVMEYGECFEELHIVLFYCGRHLPDSIRIRSNVYVYPTNHWFRYDPSYFLRAFRIGSRILKQNHFNPLQDVMTAQDPFPTGCSAYCLRVWSGIPLQLQIHIDFFKSRFKYESFMNYAYAICGRILFPRADAIRAVSGEIKKYCVKELRIPEPRVAVLPVFSDVLGIDAAQPAFVIRNRYIRYTFLVLLLARLVPQKNIAMAVRAMDYIARQNSHIALIIVGSGAEEVALRRMAASSAAHSAIFFEPWTDDIISYYKGADMFLFPSWYEGWGLTVIEAMAASLPVVATSVGCVPLLIEDGKNGYIIKQDDACGAANRIMALESDSAARLRMGAAARNAVLECLPHNKKTHFKEHYRAFALALHEK